MSQRYVYFIRQGSDGPIKIGHTNDPLRRLTALQCGNPQYLKLLAVHPGGAALERTLHRYFEPCRQLNEWFEPSEELLDLIENIDELQYWDVSEPPSEERSMFLC